MAAPTILRLQMQQISRFSQCARHKFHGKQTVWCCYDVERYPERLALRSRKVCRNWPIWMTLTIHTCPHPESRKTPTTPSAARVGSARFSVLPKHNTTRCRTTKRVCWGEATMSQTASANLGGALSAGWLSSFVQGGGGWQTSPGSEAAPTTHRMGCWEPMFGKGVPKTQGDCMNFVRLAGSDVRRAIEALTPCANYVQCGQALKRTTSCSCNLPRSR